jgi:hypothetical protein
MKPSRRSQLAQKRAKRREQDIKQALKPSGKSKLRVVPPTSALTIYGKPRKGKDGRPTLLTPELQKRFVTLLRRGNYLTHACDILGIQQVTTWYWMHRGQEEIRQGLMNEPHARFFIAVKTAQGELIDECIQKIREGTDRWQSLAWLLERKLPNYFGQRQRMELTGADGGPLEVNYKPDLSKLSSDELRQLQTILSKSQAVETTTKVEDV